MMNKLIAVFLVLGLISCDEEVKVEVQAPENANNLELNKMYESDQNDRRIATIDWEVVSENDRNREERVYELLDSNKVKTSLDYHNAAMIFQHGMDSVAYGMAVNLMTKSIELDPEADKWLLAAAIDRDLMSRDKPQIYGTQFRRMGEGSPWVLYSIDTTKISDEVRVEYGVETLAEQREKVKRMNKKKLAQLLTDGKTVEEIAEFIRNEDRNESDYDLSESGINSFGYVLMTQENNKEALVIFRLNTELYPNGFNTYDSYGECLLDLGEKESAIAAYKRSLELNPKNTNAEKVIAGLK